MFKRVRDSLVYPREILKYRKDHILFVLFYLFFFAVLLSSRSIIDVIKYDGIALIYKEAMIEEMVPITEDCEIANALLVCDAEYIVAFYEDAMFTIYLDSNSTLDFSQYPSNEYSIIVHDDSVYAYVFGISALEEIPLSSLPSSLQNLDFEDQTNDSEAFYEQLFAGIDQLIVDYKIIWGTSMVLFEVMISTLFYLVFVLISSWFLKTRYKVIPFKETFTMTTYSSTSLFIILTFYSMLELNIFIVIILLVIAFRQNGIMTKEIDRILKKKS